MGRPKNEVNQNQEEKSVEIEKPLVVVDAKDHITVTLKELVDRAQKLLHWASTDYDYVKRSRNEAIYLAQKNQAVIDAIKSQEEHLENLKAQGRTILVDAKREVEGIKNAADEVLAMAHRDRSEAKKLKEDAERELALARMKVKEMVV